MKIELFPYQQAAADSAVAVFSHLADQLKELQDAKNADARRAAVAFNGALLLEAPTGSGKTLIAADIAARTALAGKTVWLWFTPFKGLVAQTASSLRSHEAGLRFRNLAEDRDIASAKVGDVWVTTWKSVAANDSESRKILSGDESMPGLLAMVAGVRKRGLRLGVVVDEAHHGFGHKTLALDLYARLAPEFTLLVSATPDDRDALAYKDRGGFAHVEHIRIRREDAVSAGLVKPGVRSVVFIPKDASSDRLADFDEAALRHGLDRHKRIREGLRTHGINLTPLLLVQVGAEKDAIGRTKATLLRLGMPESAIATYTAEEPDANLLTLAADESKEVLIFKMAVALGFDAPRAQTLVSLRSVNDADFGTQLIGRLLRVHSRARAKSLSGELPEWLRVAYVFLADRESQTGLFDAAKRVNILDGKLAAVCPHTVLTVMGDEVVLQIVKDGQPRLIPAESELPPSLTPVESDDEPPASSDVKSPVPFADGMVTDLWGDAIPSPEPKSRAVAKSAPGVSVAAKPASYPIRGDVPRILRVVRQKPSANFEQAIVAKMKFDDSALTEGRRAWLHYQKQESELFGGSGVQGSEAVKIKVDPRRIAVLVQQEFFTRDETVDCKRLRELLIRKLKDCYEKAGDPIAENDEAIEEALDRILYGFEDRLKEAKKAALAITTEAADALSPLPAEYTPSGLVTPSAKNIYGVFPEDLNTWERPFAELLDADDTVLWWHRNPVRKDWSVAVLMQNGANSYPDFVIALKDRPNRDHILLLDTKEAFNGRNMNEKVKVVHPDYGKTLFVTRDSDGRWVTVVYNEKLKQNQWDAPLRIADLVHGHQ